MEIKKRYACITFVTTSSYVIGALVLGQSLRQTGWGHETVVLVTPNIGAEDRERLNRIWQRVVEVQPIANPIPAEKHGMHTFTTTYTKLRIWEQTDYDKLIYLDADAIVLGSLEELITRPRFAAAHCMSALDLFNSAVMVVEPSQETFNDMMTKVGTLPSYDGGDQGFLNSYFPDWFEGPPESRLPARYNVPRIFYYYEPSWKRLFDDMRVLHFNGTFKPWMTKRRLMRKLYKWLSLLITTSPRTYDTPTDMWWSVHKNLDVLTAAKKGTLTPRQPSQTPSSRS